MSFVGEEVEVDPRRAGPASLQPATPGKTQGDKKQSSGWLSGISNRWFGDKKDPEQEEPQHRRSPLQQFHSLSVTEQPRAPIERRRSYDQPLDDFGGDWEDVTKDEALTLDQALKELETLREVHAKSSLRMADLERTAKVAEQSARSKEGAIVQLMAENRRLKMKKTGHSTDALEDIDVSGLVTRIDDFQTNEEKLQTEVKEKEDQRYHATQLNLKLQNELQVSQDAVSELKLRYDQTTQELARMKEMLDIKPGDCEIPEDVDPEVLVAQLRERIKLLETQNDQIRQHVREQSRQMQILRQDGEARELVQQDSSSYQSLHEHSERNLSAAQAAIRAKTKEIEALQRELDHKEIHYADNQRYSEQTQHQFKAMRDKYNELEEQYHIMLGSNNRLRQELQEAKAQVESEQAQVLTYKMDFEEERKDRAAAHSKFADIEKEMIEQRNGYVAQITGLNEEVALQKRLNTGHEQSMKKVIEELKQWKEEAKESRDIVKEKIAQLKAYKKQVDEVTRVLQERETQIEDLTGNFARLSEEKSKAEHDVLKYKKKTSAGEPPSSLAGLDGLQQKLAKTEKLCDNLQTENLSLRKKVESESKTSLRLENAHLSAANDTLKDEKAAAERKLSDLTPIMKDMEIEISDLKQQLSAKEMNSKDKFEGQLQQQLHHHGKMQPPCHHYNGQPPPAVRELQQGYPMAGYGAMEVTRDGAATNQWQQPPLVYSSQPELPQNHSTEVPPRFSSEGLTPDHQPHYNRPLDHIPREKPGTLGYQRDIQKSSGEQSPGSVQRPTPKPRQASNKANTPTEAPLALEGPQFNPNDTQLLVLKDELTENIDNEIKEVAWGVMGSDQDEGAMEEAPLDPNLVCPMCMKQYHIGQIQFFRAHVGKCDGST